MKKIILIIAIAFWINANLIAQSVTPVIDLYYSEQTQNFSKKSGSHTVKTEDNQSANAILSITGPIKYEITPNNLSILPNKTIKWDGKVYPDNTFEPYPSPGDSKAAKLTCNYTYTINGIVEPPKTCYQDFMVHSINLTVPQFKMLGKENTMNITATCYPLNGGVVTWNTSNNKIQIINSNGNIVKIKGINLGISRLTATVTYPGGVVRTAMCKVRVLQIIINMLPPTYNTNYDPNDPNSRYLTFKFRATCPPVGGKFSFITIPPDLRIGNTTNPITGITTLWIRKPANLNTLQITATSKIYPTTVVRTFHPWDLIF